MKKSKGRELLVSVIIPDFNHALYVADAIDSVLRQEYRNYEIIVVDDGSTDNSREIIAQFGDKVNYIYQDNKGLSAARNTGIRMARGALIGVLDADDMYEPTFLNTIVDAFHASPEVDGVYCGYRFIDEENNPLPQVENRPVSSDKLYGALLDGNFFVPESIVLRKSVFDNLGLFDESLRACEDWDVWLRVTKKYKVIHVPGILTRHRILAGSMSSDPQRMLDNRMAVLKKHQGDEPVSAGSSMKHRAYGRAYLGSCVEYIQYGNEEGAFECLQKMSNICPSLLTEADTFYQLGCGHQPKGQMGDLATLDIERGTQYVLSAMSKLFDHAGTSTAVKQLRREANARMYFTLGVLAYGTKDFRKVSRLFMRAVLTKPGLFIERQLVELWLKSLAGIKLVELLRRMKRQYGSVLSDKTGNHIL